jgi:hypothetical protein
MGKFGNPYSTGCNTRLLLWLAKGTEVHYNQTLKPDKNNN